MLDACIIKGQHALLCFLFTHLSSTHFPTLQMLQRRGETQPEGHTGRIHESLSKINKSKANMFLNLTFRTLEEIDKLSIHRLHHLF